MSLLRLLTTGKSLEGVGGYVNRYRVTRQRLLPKFGGVANPFQATTRPANSAATPAPAEKPAPRSTSAAPTVREPKSPKSWWRLWTAARPQSTGAAALFRGKSQPQPAPVPAAAKPSETPAAPAKSAPPQSKTSPVPVTQEKTLNPMQRCIRWLTGNRKLNWFQRRNAPPAPKPAVVFHPSAQGPSQGELLLEQVRPIRNDLCDSDLEVVAAKPVEPTAANQPAEAPQNLDAEAAANSNPVEPSPSDKAWERVTRQLSETEKS